MTLFFEEKFEVSIFPNKSSTFPGPVKLRISVKNSDKVADLKDKIQGKLNDASKYEGVFLKKGKKALRLEDDKSLSDYNITEQSLLAASQYVETHLHFTDRGKTIRYNECIPRKSKESMSDFISKMQEKYKRLITEIQDENGTRVINLNQPLRHFFKLHIKLCDLKLRLKFLTKVEELKAQEYKCVHHIKGFIRQKYIRHHNDQIILLDGRKLNDHEILQNLILDRNHDISENTLSLNVIIQEKSFELYVHLIWENKDLKLDVKSSDTISDIKLQIQDRTGVPLKNL
eukprot:TCONS_00005815-protein